MSLDAFSSIGNFSEQTSQLVEIEPSRRLNLVCQGQGFPTVILEAGLGDTSAAWHLVQSEVAHVTRVCAYDRAGLGLSDPGPMPRTSSAIANDLHALLHQAGLPPPYVIVAHSMGALGAMLFADRHLPELAGMVLVDPSFVDQAETLAPYLPEAAPRGDPTTVAGSEAESMSSLSGDPEESDSAQLKAEARDLGSLPMIVLTAADTGGTDGNDQRVIAGKALWKAGHEALAACSSQGVSRMVPHSGHSIHLDQPGIVTSAILELVGRSRQATDERQAP
jgi:pimeloyl-ACP methyl ester carboxylesterase